MAAEEVAEPTSGAKKNHAQTWVASPGPAVDLRLTCADEDDVMARDPVGDVVGLVLLALADDLLARDELVVAAVLLDDLGLSTGVDELAAFSASPSNSSE